MKHISEFLSRNVGVEPWVASLIAIALVTLILNQVAQVLLRHAAKVTRRTRTVWDNALVSTASRPILVAMWVIGLGFMARVLQHEIEQPFITEVLALRDVALILCVAWFVLRFIGQVGRNIIAARTASGDEVDHTTIDALVKLARTWNPFPNVAEHRSGRSAWAGAIYSLALFVLAFVGALRLWRNRRGQLALLLAPVLYFSLVHMVYVGSVRYRVPLMPLLAVVGCAAISPRGPLPPACPPVAR